MKKQIIASILAAGTFMSAMPIMAQVPQDVKGTKFETPVSVLSALKIMNGDENGEYRLDDTIIRSELVKMAVTAMGMQESAESSKGPVMYDDVSSEHWANGYINLATSLGIVEGDGDGGFRPNDNISYQEAATIMVRAAGYETAAQTKGGYPKGYLTVASENKMLAGVEGKADAAISRGNVAILTNNTLEVNKMEQTGFGPNAQFTVVNKTLLSDNLKTEIVTGQVKAIGDMTLAGVKPVNEGRIMIGDEVYNYGYNVKNVLGYNVKAYAQTDSYNEKDVILAMPVAGKNTSIEITADLFEGLGVKNGNDTVEYYESENSSKKKTAVIAKSAQLIYNNRSVEYDKDLIDIADKNAFLSMLDTDADGNFDIVFITEYENIVVEFATAQKIVAMDGSTLRLDNIEYKLYQGMTELEPNHLKKWDILSVVKSPTDDYHEMYMTRKSVRGKITAKKDNVYTIDGTAYKTATGFDKVLSVGDRAEFMLDISGKIAGVKGMSEVSDQYAYLTNAYEAQDRDSVAVKIVDRYGKPLTLTLSSKVRFNGESMKDTDVLGKLKSEGSVIKQLITYTKNTQDMVTEINTAEDKSLTGAVDEDKFTLNKKLEDTVYQASTSKLGNVRVTDNTIVFDISDIENIRIGNKSTFSDNQKYSGLVYDMTENFDAGVIVLTDTAFKPEINAPAAVIKSIAKGMNDDDEEIDIVTLLSEGKEITLNTENVSVLVKNNGEKLEVGDIIQYKTNTKNEIAGIRLLFDIDTRETEFIKEPEKDLSLVYGKVDKMFNSSMNVSVNGASSMNYEVGDGVKVYSIDVKNTKNTVSLGEFKDISAYDADENNRVFIRLFDDAVKEIVIVK